MFYELAASSWGEEEIAAIQKVIASGMFTMGKYVKQFEDDFAKKVGSKYVVMVNSGSSANLLAVASLFFKDNQPLQRGDEVVVPAISWATTYYPLMQYGLKLKFVDVELDSLNIDITKLEQALSPKTRAIVAVNVLGNPASLDKIRTFSDAHNLYFIEDNCESMGAELNGKQCGTFGDIGTFSCFFSHHISTMEGGVLVTDNEELYHIAVSMRSHGWTRSLPADSMVYKKAEDDFYEEYKFIFPGYNVRATELNGAVGIEQLKKLDGFVEKRRDNAKIFVDLLQNDERFIIQRENGKSSWFAFTIILNSKYKINRQKVMAALKEADIDYRIITGGNFLRHDVIKHCDHECVGEIINANIAHDKGFFVGNQPYDLRKQIEFFYEVLSNASSG